MPFDGQDANAVAKLVFGESASGWLRGTSTVVISPIGSDYRAERVSVTYARLRKLSEELGTTRIDIEYERETGPYSDVTPGDPSEFLIIARLREPKGDDRG
jgi:hypothetical protein